MHQIKPTTQAGDNGKKQETMEKSTAAQAMPNHTMKNRVEASSLHMTKASKTTEHTGLQGCAHMRPVIRSSGSWRPRTCTLCKVCKNMSCPVAATYFHLQDKSPAICLTAQRPVRPVQPRPGDGIWWSSAQTPVISDRSTAWGSNSVKPAFPLRLTNQARQASGQGARWPLCSLVIEYALPYLHMHTCMHVHACHGCVLFAKAVRCVRCVAGPCIRLCMAGGSSYAEQRGTTPGLLCGG